MRYSEKHKLQTHAKILREASRLFREKGYNNVGIDAVMEKAGLTRGGFYGHFRSKRDLYNNVLKGNHEFVDRMRARKGASRQALSLQGKQIAKDYTSPEYRKQILKGCALASLAMDTIRASKTAKLAYANTVRELADEFSRGIENAKPLDERALQAIFTSVGALIVASASASDGELADAISLAAQNQLDHILD